MSEAELPDYGTMVGKLNSLLFSGGARLGLPRNFSSGAQRFDDQAFITREQAAVAKGVAAIEHTAAKNKLIKEAPVRPAEQIIAALLECSPSAE